MKLYIQGKDHGRIILNSVENGPLVWPTVEQEDGAIRLKTHEELSDKEKLQADCDLKATNIVLQGLPPDVYALVNHHKIANDIWDRVKLLMQGTSLSKQERVCKLFDEFDKLSHVKGETLLPPEWGKFVTDVKLTRYLHTSNHDQLYAYLEQHEAHANEVRFMRERFPDLLALVANFHQPPSQFNNYHSQYTTPYLAVPTFLPSDDPIACMNKEMEFLSVVFSPRYPSTNNQLISSFNPRNQATVQDSGVTVQQVQGRQGQNVVGLESQRNASAQAEGKELDEEQLAFLADPRVTDGQVAQTITHNAAFETYNLDAYDPDCDDISSAKAVLMANLSSCDLDVLSEFIDSQMDDMIQKKNTKFATFETEIDTLKQTLSKHVKEKESLLTTLNSFKMKFKERESKSIDKETVLENKYRELESIISQRIKQTLYDGNVLSKIHADIPVVDEEETLILAEESRLKMQMFWLQSSNKNSEEPSTSNTPIKIEVPSELPKLKDFFKEFDKGLPDEITKVQTVFTQMEAAVEQCFINEPVDISNKCLKLKAEFVKKNDAYIELSKRFSNHEQHCISLEVAMQLNQEIFQKDKSCVNQNAPEIYEYFEQNDLQAQLHAKDTVISKLKETIHSLRDNANPAKVKKDIDEIETINIELEHSVAKLLSKNEFLHKGIEHLKKIYKDQFDSIKETRTCSKEHSDSLIAQLNSKSMENADLKAQIQEKVFATAELQNELKRLKDQSPQVNTKNNRISQSSSSNKTNKVEDQSRSVKSRKNKKNHVVKTECNAYVMQSMLNANSKSVCAICNECLFDENHDKCVLDYVHDVNVLSKFKPAKSKNKKQIWKPTGKVFTEISYKWKPTRRTFTIVGNKCPLTRFTSTKVVPLKETTKQSIPTPTQGIKVYSRRPKATKYVGSSSKSKITESRISNNLEPTQAGESTISNVPSSSLIDYRVYYVEGLGHNLFSVGQFCDSDLEVAFRKHTCFVCNLEGVDLLTGSRGTNLYTLSIGDMMKSSPIYLLSKASKTKSWPMRVESNNGKKYILVIVDDYSRFTWVKFLRSKDEALEFIIKYYEDVAKAPLFMWEEAVATSCYTQNRSLIRLRYGKTPYELLHDRKPDLSYLHVFGALCYLTNDSEDLGKLKAKADVDFDELTVMASEQSSSGPALNERTPGTLSSGLVPQHPSSTPFVPPIRNDWDILLQPLFDEYFRPPPSVDHPVPEVAAPEPDVSTGTPSSTIVDQDAPSPSTLQTPRESPSHVIPPGAKEADPYIEVAHMVNNPYVGFLIPEPSFEESSSQVVLPNNVHLVNQPPEHISK
ncbi:retrovirus-related pol polyprotein from transposon TNT 1-94 [Tanacetum coccineum]|uniref:Retrovirus-related pol polyprotein from transposon TNT 1-94 n=1 Tax=Tanacetum coccineum TaxID=301880 RepID=A0ABQ5B5A7_9ASTR